MLEVHPDHDSARLNDLLGKYCRKRRIAMSRSRPYQKNGNAWVEQKNRTRVRNLVGCRRHDPEAEQELPRKLYQLWSDEQNFFRPVMKLQAKSRVGGKVRRVDEEAQTP